MSEYIKDFVKNCVECWKHRKRENVVIEAFEVYEKENQAYLKKFYLDK